MIESLGIFLDLSREVLSFFGVGVFENCRVRDFVGLRDRVVIDGNL